MFDVFTKGILAPKKEFKELYENHKDCFGNDLPERSINNELEELLDTDTAIQAYNAANRYLDEKVRSGKDIKSNGYKLLTALITIQIAVLGLAGYVYVHNELSAVVRYISIIVLSVGILWLFSIIIYLSEHLLKGSDFWHSGQDPARFVNQPLLVWCQENGKEKAKHTICYEINRIQEKIALNESENKRRVAVINTTLNHLKWFVSMLVSCILIFMALTF